MFPKLNKFLKKKSIIVAGSACTSAFLKEEPYKNSDIDLWVKFPLEIKENFDENIDNLINEYYEIKQLFPSFISCDCTYKYPINERFIPAIAGMINYEFENKRVQLIFTFCNPMNIIDRFDLSCCAIAWDGAKFILNDEQLTKNKIAYYQNSPCLKEQERKQKYIERGFKIFETKEEAYNELEKIENVVYWEKGGGGYTRFSGVFSKSFIPSSEQKLKVSNYISKIFNRKYKIEEIEHFLMLDQYMNYDFRLLMKDGTRITQEIVNPDEILQLNILDKQIYKKGDGKASFTYHSAAVY